MSKRKQTAIVTVHNGTDNIRQTRRRNVLLIVGGTEYTAVIGEHFWRGHTDFAVFYRYFAARSSCNGRVEQRYLPFLSINLKNDI